MISCPDMLLKSLFFISLFFVFYAYAGYPIYLYVLTRMFPKPIKKRASDSFVFVSVIIAAKNEAQNIEKRINNLLQQDYPSDVMEIIVVSDGSDDDTKLIVQELANRVGGPPVRIRCYEYFPSQGKPSALNYGVQQASGEVIVFTDARQIFKENVVTELVKNFSDPTVGGVSGELVFLEEGESTIKVPMGAYWKYEKKIRKMESDTGSVVGATGAIYAIRKKLYKPLPPATLLDDVLTPMNIVMQGNRLVFDSFAIAYDVLSKDASQEWHRKVRTLAGNWQLLSLNSNLIFPHRNPLWLRFVSHKLARVFVPFFLILLFVTGSLQTEIFYRLATVGQIIFYLTALLAYAFPKSRNNSIVQVSYFFCVLNLAAVKGFFVWLSGGCESVWSSGGRT